MNTDSKTSNIGLSKNKTSSSEVKVALPPTLREKINAADTAGVHFDIKKPVSETIPPTAKNASAIPTVRSQHTVHRSFSENMRSAFDEWWSKVKAMNTVKNDSDIEGSQTAEKVASVPRPVPTPPESTPKTSTTESKHSSFEKIRTFKEDLARAQSKLHEEDRATPVPVPAPVAPATPTPKDAALPDKILPGPKATETVLLLDTVHAPLLASTEKLSEESRTTEPLRTKSPLVPLSKPQTTSSVSDLAVPSPSRATQTPRSREEKNTKPTLVDNLRLAFLEWRDKMEKKFNPSPLVSQTPVSASEIPEKKFDITKTTPTLKTLTEEILPFSEALQEVKIVQPKKIPSTSSVERAPAPVTTNYPATETHNESTWTHTFPNVATKTFAEQKPIVMDLPKRIPTVQEEVIVVPIPETPKVPPSIPTPPVVETPVFHSTPSLPNDALPVKLEEKPAPAVSSPVSRIVMPFIPVKWLNRSGYICLITICTLFLSYQYSWFEEPIAPNPANTPIIIPKIFKTDTQTEFPFSFNKDVFLAELSSKIKAAPQGVSQFYPVVLSEADRHSATAEEILSVMDTRLNEKAVHSLEEVLVMGSVTTSRNEPFLVMQSFNFDMLFSSLLLWEPYLQKDLSPLFGTVSTSQSFTDGILANKPIRILKDNLGNEVLIYTFVNQNTVIITTSQNALIKILERF